MHAGCRGDSGMLAGMRRSGLGKGALAASVVAAVATVTVLVSGTADRWELPVRDLLLRLPPPLPAEHVAAVVFDEDALTRYGPWPVSRELLARVVDRVHAAGAASVVVDLLLVEPRPGDVDLAAELAAVPSIVVAAMDDSGGAWVLPAPALRSHTELAHPEFQLDHDGVVRRISSTKQVGGRSLPAVSAAVATLLSPRRPIPIGAMLIPDYRVRAGSVPTVGVASLLQHPHPELAGSVVFVGITALGLGDRVVTPVSPGQRPEPGVLVHAAIADMVHRNLLLKPISPALAGAVAVLAVALAAMLSRLGGATRVGAAVALLLTPGAAGAALLLLTGTIAPVVTLTVVAAAAVLAVEARQSLLAYERAGKVAELLEPARSPAHGRSSPESRLEHLERAASELSVWRAEEVMSRRVVAHELKTPLTSLKGLGQLLAEFDLSPDEVRRVAGLVREESTRLQTMVESLLELERTPLRDFEAESTVLDLAALLRERCELASVGAEREVRCTAPEPVPVRGHRSALTQALDNLLSNALKFSPPDAAVEAAAVVAGEAVVSVRDRGPGVADDERATIFRRFARGRAAEGVTGLGLGLSLVDTVVRWHRGTVRVDNASDGGAVFSFSLPAVGEDAG